MRLVSIPSTLHRCSPFSVSFAVQFTCLDGQPDANSLSSGSPPSTFGLVDEIECKSSCSDHRLETQKQSAAPRAGTDSSPSKRSSCTARRRLLRQASAASKRIRVYSSLYFSMQGSILIQDQFQVSLHVLQCVLYAPPLRLLVVGIWLQSIWYSTNLVCNNVLCTPPC